METRTGGVTVSVVESETAPMVALIVAVPGPIDEVASPTRLTEATASAEEDHVTYLVTSNTRPSIVAPVAANCCDPPGPNTIDGLTGVIRTELRAGGVTLITVV